MTNKNSKFAHAKKYLSIPVFAGLTLLFAEKVYANRNPETGNALSEIFQQPQPDQKNNPEALQEFMKIAEKYKEIIDHKDFKRFKKEVPRSEQVKLVELFTKIHIKNRLNLPIWIGYNEINKEIPTQKQINQFMSSKYNIMLDGKAVNNSVLKNYKNTDFYSVYSLKILPNNPDYGKYEYGVVLYTTKYAKHFNSQKNISLSFKDNGALEKVMPELIKKIDAKKVPDTIRPQEGKNTEPKQTTIQNTHSEIPANDEGVTAPQFPGGINLLRNKVAGSFDGSKLPANKNKEMYKAEIFYVVNEKGNIAEVSVTGNNGPFTDEIKSSFTKATQDIIWKPAEKDGKAVRYRMKMPITMSFE